MKRSTLKSINLFWRTRKGTKGQTALEYALVVTAISLVLMAAWNIFGARVRTLIEGSVLNRVERQLTRGNATVPER